MNGKQLAQALGLSPSMVCKLRKRGMPMTSVEAAQKWRKRHLLTTMTKGVRAGSSLGGLPPAAPASSQPTEAMPLRHGLPLPDARDDAALEALLPTLAVMTGDEAVRQVELLGWFAAQLLAQGRFGEIEQALRTAMRAVPLSRRAAFVVGIPIDDARYPAGALAATHAPAMPVAVFDELVRPAVEVLAAHGALRSEDDPPQTEAERAWSSEFLFAVAAGEVRVAAR